MLLQLSNKKTRYIICLQHLTFLYLEGKGRIGAMKYFLKLNTVSILYAIMIFISIELMFNTYRLSRLTGWDLNTVITRSMITIGIVFIIGTILTIFLSRKWLKGRKANYWTIILWIPYFALFVYSIAKFFPVIDRGDIPNPGVGLVAIGLLISFPIYILFIHFISLNRFTSRS